VAIRDVLAAGIFTSPTLKLGNCNGAELWLVLTGAFDNCSPLLVPMW